MNVYFSRSAAGADALANNYQISEDLLNKDIDKLKELGYLQALVDYHYDKQKENDKSVERVDQYLEMTQSFKIASTSNVASKNN